MKMKSRLCGFSVLLLAVLIITPAPIPAQVDQKEKAEKEVEKQKELERKTLRLLDEIIGGAWSLKLPESRSYVLAAAADLLWTRDEKHARNLFWEALTSLNLPVNATIEDSPAKDPATKASAKTSTTKSSNKSQRQSLNQYYANFAARSEFLRKVARRDPQLALDMLRTTRQTPPAEADGTLRPPDDRDLEQEIADEAVARDPKRALQIARESLAKGLSFQLLNLMFRLNQKDQNAGSEFAGDIITKLDGENLGTNLIAMVIASQLLESSRAAKAAPTSDAPAGYTFKPLKLAEEQRRHLVDLITDAALSVTANVNTLQNLSFVMPEIEELAPDRAAKIKVRMAELNRRLDRNQRELNTYNSLFEKASPEEMIKAADGMEAERRLALYREAVIAAVMRGRGDALREYINNQVEDDSRKQSLLDSLDHEQLYAAVNRGKADDLRKLLPLVRLKEQRAQALAELAIMLEKQGEHDEAVKLLEEARPLVKVDLNSENHSNALLTLLLGYALVDPGKAFAIIEPIINRVNEDISKLVLVDKIIKTGAIKNGEIVMHQPGMPLDSVMFKYAPGVTALAKADFNRTVALADRFERHELRILARLLMAQSIMRSLETPTAPAEKTGQ